MNLIKGPTVPSPQGTVQKIEPQIIMREIEAIYITLSLAALSG